MQKHGRGAPDITYKCNIRSNVRRRGDASGSTTPNGQGAAGYPAIASLRRSSLTEKFRALALLVGKLVFEWNVVRRANPVDFGVKCRPKAAWSSTVVSLKLIRWHQ